MLTNEQLSEVERAAQAMYTNEQGYDVGRCALAVNLYSATTSGFMNEARDILQRSSQLYAQQLVVRYFQTVIFPNWTTFEKDTITNMLAFFKSMLTDPRFPCNSKTFVDIARLIGWMLKKMGGSSPSAITDDIQKIMDAAQDGNVVAMYLLSHVIEVFDTVHHPYILNSNPFMSLSRQRVMRFATAHFIAYEYGELKDASIKLMVSTLQSLTHDKNDVDSVEEVTRNFMIDSDYMDIICNESFFTAISNTFQRIKSVTMINILYMCCFHSFGPSTKAKFTTMMYRCISTIMQAPDAMANSDVHQSMCRLLFLCMGKMSCSITEAEPYQEFLNLLPILLGFTFGSLNACEFAPYAPFYLIIIWSVIATQVWSSEDREKNMEPFKQQYPQILFAYMNARLKMKELELLHDDRSFRELAAFAKLFLQDQEKNMQMMLALFESSSLEDEVRMAWTLAFATALMRCTDSPKMEEKVNIVDVPLVFRVMTIVRMCVENTSLGVRYPHLCMMMISFLNVFLFQSITNYTDRSPFKTMFETANEALRFICRTSFYFLSMKNNDVDYMIAAVDLFNSCIDRISYLDMQEDDVKMMYSILELHERVFDGYIGDKSVYLTRRKFYNQLVRLTYCREFKRFFPRILNSFNARTISKDMLMDLRGVAEGCVKKKTFALLYDWIFAPNRLTAFLSVPDCVSSVIKLLCSIIQTGNSYREKSWILIFKHLVEVMQLLVNSICDAKQEIKFKFSKLLIQTINTVFETPYFCVCTSSMMYYGDSLYTQFLHLIYIIPTFLNNREFSQCKTLHEPFYRMMIYLFTHDMRNLLAQQNDALDALIKFGFRVDLVVIDKIGYYTEMATLCKRARQYQMQERFKKLQSGMMNYYMKKSYDRVSLMQNKPLYQAIRLSPLHAEQCLAAFMSRCVSTKEIESKRMFISFMISSAQRNVSYRDFMNQIEIPYTVNTDGVYIITQKNNNADLVLL